MGTKKKKGSDLVLRATPRRAAHSSQKESKQKRSYDGPSSRSWIWWSVKWLFILGLWGAFFLIGVLAYFAADLRDITRSANFEKQTSIVVLADDGSVIARYGEAKGRSVNAEDMPKDLINAVLATEDRRFYDHPGIDAFGLLRAVVVNAIEGRYVQGGSTITQQLAKNLFLTHERTMKRKIQEALLALWLEYQLTKDEILSAYLNRVYLGSGVYGMDAAAQLYFDKSVKDIDLREAATLAGLLKAPSKYSPLNNPALSKQRADVVLFAMADAGYITEAEAKGLVKSAPKPRKKPSGGKASKYFSDWVIDGIDDLIGTPDMDLVIETTMNTALQNEAEHSLNSVLAESGAANKISQGAVVVMRPDGAVISLVGGRDYSMSEFNRAIQAQRSAGSTFKPFVYISALEQGWQPNSPILDAPITEGRYRPENYGGKYYGNVMISDALALSMNTATIRLMKDVGVSSVVSTARKMGILSKLEPNLSTGLGSSGINMLELTTAYASLANGGHRVFPYAIKRIKDAKGRILYERKEPSSYTRILSSSVVYNIQTMMAGVLERGTGQRARTPFPAAGKTGTSQDSRDAWFVGFTDRAAVSVWLGNDDNSPMKGVTGGIYPAQIWKSVMQKAYYLYGAQVFDSGDYVADTYSGNYGYQDEQLEAEETSSNDNSADGIGGLIGRLLDDKPAQSDNAGRRSKGDYSNLNE